MQRAYTLRQSLLRAELLEMRARLEKTQQSLDMRDRIADQIVDRRVEDLLNPQLHWEGGTASGQPLTQSVSPNGQTIDLPAPVDAKAGLLSKLQGTWDVKQMFQEEAKAELTTVSLKALVDGNRISLSGTDGSNPATFDLQLGAAGPPQQVDLRPVLTKAELEDLQMNQVPNVNMTFPGIIEVTDDGIRLCLDNSQLDQRPIVFAAGPATGLWELRRGVAVPVAVTETELEGDWHLVSIKDKAGDPVDVQPMNLSFRNDRYTLSYQGYQNERRVEVYPDQKEIRYFADGDDAFTRDQYLMDSDQLTIYTENRRNVYHRGHVALPKSIAKATDEQKTRWRSGIVDIIAHDAKVHPSDHKRVGYGVILSPQMLIVAQLKLTEGDWSFSAKFDDGGIVPIKIVEEGPQGWVTFQPEKAIEVNHHFQLSTVAVGQHDEVNFWGRSAKVSEQPIPELFTTTVTALDRKSPAMGSTVWQLRSLDRSLDRLEGSLPVLDANGDVLAIGLIGTGDLFLAVPVSQLKTMFPKSFGPAAPMAE